MNHREASRNEWAIVGLANLQEINTGSFQRIADATEKMASSYNQLRNDRDYYKKRTEEESKRKEAAYRRIIALKGVITRMKKVRP